MLDDAIAYPRRDEDEWLRTTLVGGLALVLGFVPVLPELVLGGYYARLLSTPESETPPRFEDWEDLLIDGLRLFVVSLVYTLVPAFLLGLLGAMFAAVVGIGALTLPVEPGSGAARSLGAVVFLAVVFLWVVALVLGLVAAYVAPAAAALAARDESLGAGFDFGRVRRVVGSGDYAGAWLRALLVVAVGSLVGGALVIVFFLGLFVVFYATVVATRLLAVGVDRALTTG